MRVLWSELIFFLRRYPSVYAGCETFFNFFSKKGLQWFVRYTLSEISKGTKPTNKTNHTHTQYTMKTRVTLSDLKARLFDLNESKGFQTEPYSKQGDKLEANVNTFYLSQAYGGYNVYQMVNKSGGVREPAGYGHVTKRECLERINSLFN